MLLCRRLYMYTIHIYIHIVINEIRLSEQPFQHLFFIFITLYRYVVQVYTAIYYITMECIYTCAKDLCVHGIFAFVHCARLCVRGDNNSAINGMPRWGGRLDGATCIAALHTYINATGDVRRRGIFCIICI